MAKILVVDDQQDMLELIQLVLSLENHEVICLEEPETVIETAEKEKPDAIILDIVMPRMDGYQVLKKIRESRQLSQVPVAFLTSNNKTVDFMVGLHMLKADDYITKPFGKQDLLERVERLLKKKTG